MRKPISNKAFTECDAGLAFTLNEMANKRKSEGARVINVTLGTFYNDEGKLVSFSKINELLEKNNNESSLSYASLDGGNLFKTNVKSWVFGSYKHEIDNKYFSDACATPGGAGALYLSFRNYSEDNPILIPSIGWNNYKAMCKQLNKPYECYEMFKDGKLDIVNIISLCEESIRKFEYCTLLINDPCQNPTGYTLSDDEWDCLINELNVLSEKGAVNLILDVAYMDMAQEPRRFLKHIVNKSVEFNTLLCFSASKLFGVYGLRLGALICVNKLQENVLDFINTSKITSRAVWSNCNHLMINAFNDFLANKDMHSLLLSELEDHKKVLKRRYSEAKEMFDKIIGSEPLPYKEGFFVVYPKENALEFNEELIKKDIFALPIENKYIRISICSFYK